MRPLSTAARALSTLALLALLLLAGPGLGPAEAQSRPSVTAELGYRSLYLFAGVPSALGDVMEGTLTLEAGPLTAGGFTVYDIDGSELIEADLWADYRFRLAPLFGAFVGAAYYNFLLYEDDDEGAWEGSPELYAGVFLNAPFNPTLTVAHDFDLGDGTHATLGLSDSFDLGSSGLWVDLGGDLDYNHRYYVEIEGFSYADLWVSLGVPLGPVTLSPIALFQFGIDDSTYFGEANYPDEQVWGVTASLTF